MCVIHLLWSHKANRTARKLISMDNCSLFELSRGLTLTVKAEVSCCPPVDNWKCCLLAVCWYTTSCPQFFKLHCKLFKTGTPKWHTRWCLHLFFKLNIKNDQISSCIPRLQKIHVTGWQVRCRIILGQSSKVMLPILRNHTSNRTVVVVVYWYAVD